jgi:hypothetical protein
LATILRQCKRIVVPRQAGGAMTSRIRYGATVLLMLAAGFSLGSALQAGAQTASSVWPSDIATPRVGAAPDAADAKDAGDADEADTTKDAETKDADAKPADTTNAATNDPDIANLDWSQLNIDASTLAGQAAKARLPQAGPSPGMTWSSQQKPDGSSAVSVKQPLSPFWDARVGADMTVAREPTTLSELLAEKATNGGSEPQSSGTAYAAVTAPGVGSIWDKTAVEARLDPSQEQSRLGTSLSKSLPLNPQYSLSLQNDYNITQQGIVPMPGLVPERPLRSYATGQSATLSMIETGTSLIAGQSLSSAEDKWLRKFGVEQKLFGAVSIAGTVGETPGGAANKSITAGFKQSW